MPLRLALSTKGRFYVRIFGRKQILISGPDLSQTFIAAKIVCKIYSIPFIDLPIAKTKFSVEIGTKTSLKYLIECEFCLQLLQLFDHFIVTSAKSIIRF